MADIQGFVNDLQQKGQQAMQAGQDMLGKAQQAAQNVAGHFGGGQDSQSQGQYSQGYGQAAGQAQQAYQQGADQAQQWAGQAQQTGQQYADQARQAFGQS